MSHLAELLEHPGHFAHHVPHALAHRPRTTIGSIVVVGLGIAALIWLWPELQRYIRIKRM